MPETHVTVNGGGQWLTWARGRLNAFNALGLPVMTKDYVMPDGATVRVRKTPWGNYIDLKQQTGGYVCLPHTTALPGGEVRDALGNTVVPEAFVTLRKTSDAPVEYAAKAKEHKKVKTGTNDWRGKVKGEDVILTYSAHDKRYRMFEDPPTPQPHLYYKGKEVSTRFFRSSATSDNPVLGAGIAVSPRGVPVFIFFSPDWSTGNYRTGDVFYRPVAGGDWWKAGTFDLTPYTFVAGSQVQAMFVDPVYFSPDGTKFVTVVRASYIWERGRKLEATITLVDQPDGKVTATAAFTVAAEEPIPTINEYNFDPGTPGTLSLQSLMSGTERRDTYSGSNHTWQVTNWSVNIEVIPQESRSSTSLKVQYTYLMAYDYDSTGALRRLDYRTTVEQSSSGTASGTSAGVGGISSEQIDSGVTYGPFTPGQTITGSPPSFEEAWPLIMGAIVGTQNVTTTSESVSLTKTEILLDGAVLVELEGGRPTSSGSTTTLARITPTVTSSGPTGLMGVEYYDTSTKSDDITYRTFVVHHLDARDGSYVISALERKTNESTFDPVYNFKFYTSAKTVDGVAKYDFDSFSSKAIVAHASASGRYVFPAKASSAAYASRKSGEYLMSTSAQNIWDDLKDHLYPVGLPPPPALIQGVTKAVSKPSTETKRLFTLGAQPGFAVNPITIF